MHAVFNIKLSVPTFCINCINNRLETEIQNFVIVDSYCLKISNFMLMYSDDN